MSEKLNNTIHEADRHSELDSESRLQQVSDTPTVEVLICTMNEGIESVITNMLPQLRDVLVTVSHQITDNKYISHFQFPSNVQYLTLHSAGLSKNRNNALTYARGDVCVIADDDIVYVENFEELIKNAYQKHVNAAAITFQAEGLERWHKEFAHNWRTVGQVTSWMITFRRDWVQNNDVLFDERFGLGAKYPQGEENIFLADIRKAGGAIMALPQVLVQHPDISSGFVFTTERITAKIAAVRRMYGRLAALAAIITFTITKHKHYKKQNISMVDFITYGKDGLHDI